VLEGATRAASGASVYYYAWHLGLSRETTPPYLVQEWEKRASSRHRFLYLCIMVSRVD